MDTNAESMNNIAKSVNQDIVINTGTKESIKKKFNVSEDLLPIPKEERTWGTGNYGSLWMGSIHNIPSYMTIGGFFALGLSVYQVFGVIMASSVVLAAMLILNGKMGVKYGTSFSMALRASYGSKGSVLPGFLRGCIAAIMWFAFQTFAGSQAVTILIAKIWPGYLEIGQGIDILGIGVPGLISFLIFWACNVALIFGGMNALGKFTKILSVLVYVVFIGMAIWAINLAGGLSPILDYTPKPMSGNSIVVLLGCMTAILATWAAPIVSVSDMGREAKSTKDYTVGNVVGIVLPFLLFAVASITILIGSEVAFGTSIWNVVDVIQKFDSTFAIAVAVLTLCLTTLSVNVVGNIIPAGYQLAALFPKKLNFKRGGLVVAAIGVLVMPWKLAENSTSIFTFLNLIGGLLGPVTGVMLADYFMIKKKKIDLDALYSGKGIYEYSKGYNVPAFVVTIIAAVVSLIGQFVPVFKPIYDMSWIVGTGLAFLLYFLWMKGKAGNKTLN